MADDAPGPTPAPYEQLLRTAASQSSVAEPDCAVIEATLRAGALDVHMELGGGAGDGGEGWLVKPSHDASHAFAPTGQSAHEPGPSHVGHGGGPGGVGGSKSARGALSSTTAPKIRASPATALPLEDATA